MSDFGQNLRELVSKGMEAIGNTASSIASTTRQKVNELNVSARKKELYEALGEQVYIAWLNGEEFPDSMAESLRELLRLDQQSHTGGEESTAEASEEQEQAFAEPAEENQNLITRLNQSPKRNINRLRSADCHQDICFRIIAEPVSALQIQ